jgi:serine/threonine-protein kinase
MSLLPGLVRPPWGLVWDTRGRLFFGAEDGRIWVIPAEGAPTTVTTLGEGQLAHTLPWPLPGGRALLYTVRKRSWSWGDEQVVAQSLPAGTSKVVVNDAADARYVPTGHLLFLRRGVLCAVPFDAERLEARGPEVAVLDTVAQALTASNAFDITGAGQFAVAATGTLAWVANRTVSFADAALVTIDRRGQVSPLPAPVRAYGPSVRLSPDGRRLAVVIRSLTEAGVWNYDLNRGSLTLLAGSGEAMWPIWSRDGRRLLFDWLTDGRRALAAQPADGTASPQVIVPGSWLNASSVTPDGRQMTAVHEPDTDILSVVVENGQTRVQPLIQ